MWVIRKVINYVLWRIVKKIHFFIYRKAMIEKLEGVRVIFQFVYVKRRLFGLHNQK